MPGRNLGRCRIFIRITLYCESAVIMDIQTLCSPSSANTSHESKFSPLPEHSQLSISYEPYAIRRLPALDMGETLRRTQQQTPPPMTVTGILQRLERLSDIQQQANDSHRNLRVIAVDGADKSLILFVCKVLHDHYTQQGIHAVKVFQFMPEKGTVPTFKSTYLRLIQYWAKIWDLAATEAHMYAKHSNAQPR